MMFRTAVYFIATLLIVVFASAVSSHFWAGEQEIQPESIAVTIGEGMTVAEFGKKNEIDRKVLKKVFNLSSPDDLKQQVADFGMGQEQLNKKVNQALAEKVSFFKSRVNYDKCISCRACSKACPSTVMDAILKQDRVIPDCFSCGTCIETCPVKAISFERGKRLKPPAEKFDKEVISNQDM